MEAVVDHSRRPGKVADVHSVPAGVEVDRSRQLVLSFDAEFGRRAELRHVAPIAEAFVSADGEREIDGAGEVIDQSRGDDPVFSDRLAVPRGHELARRRELPTVVGDEPSQPELRAEQVVLGVGVDLRVAEDPRGRNPRASRLNSSLNWRYRTPKNHSHMPPCSRGVGADEEIELRSRYPGAVSLSRRSANQTHRFWRFPETPEGRSGACSSGHSPVLVVEVGLDPTVAVDLREPVELEVAEQPTDVLVDLAELIRWPIIQIDW